jgi:hypothetical protein
MKIKAIPTTYAGTNFRSRLEARWAAYFDELRIPWEYEPFDLEGWAPDFAITVLSEQVLVEIKPTKLTQLFTNHPRLTGGLRRLESGKEFEKAANHQKQHWVLCCGQRPNEDADYFGFGLLFDPPKNTTADWFEMSRAMGSNATEAAWRAAGNAVQWKGVPS